MAKYSNTIEYQISTKLDPSGLTKLQTQLQDVETTLKKLTNGSNIDLGLNKSIEQVRELSNILTKSFNSSLKTLDLSVFKKELSQSSVTAQGLATAFKQAGAQGKLAFTDLLGQFGRIDTSLKRTSSTVDKMFNTIGNTVRWGIVSSGFSQILTSLHQSVDYVKELDDSLTQIMLVTDYSRQQMNEYAKSANEAAKALGSTTVGMTNASLVFAQQGFDMGQSQDLAELSVKLANASQQDTATTSDQITALMNAYNLSGNIQDLSKALDSWALVANISAADVEELAKASQKAASSASTVGVNLDQMNAQIATIESVTRDAPEQIGNGLKTLYSRLSDIKLGETLEDGVGLGQVTSTLESIGVKVLDQMGEMRNVGDIIEDLMVVWDDLDQTAKEAAGQAIAGKYQLNRFYALMDNSDMYQQYKEGSENAEGTLNQMNEEFVNSLEGKMNKLQATWEDLFNSLFDTDNIYPFIDAATAALDIVDEIVDSIGGGIPVLTGLLAVFTKMFSSNIAQQITDYEFNRNLTNTKIANAEAAPELLNYFSSANPNFLPNQEEMVKQLSLLKENSKNLSQEQLNLASQEVDTLLQNTKELVMANENLEKTATTMRASLGSIFSDSDIVFKDEGGKWDFFNAEALFGEIQNNTESAKNFGKAIKETQNTISGMIGDVGKVESNFRSLEKALNQGKTETERFDTIWNNTNDTLQKLINNTEDFRSVLNPEKVDEFVETLKILQEELGTNADQFVWNKEKVVEFLKELFEVKDALTDVQSGGLQKLEQVLNNSARQRTQVNFAERKQETSVKNIGAINEGAENTAQKKQIIEVTSALGELTFSWQAFQNLGSLWNNKDTSVGEKILQTIMNLSMALPGLINSLKTLKSFDFISAFADIKDSIKGIFEKINPLSYGEKIIQNENAEILKENDEIIKKYEEKIEEQSQKVDEVRQKRLELQRKIGNLEKDQIDLDEKIQTQSNIFDENIKQGHQDMASVASEKMTQHSKQKIINQKEIDDAKKTLSKYNIELKNVSTELDNVKKVGAQTFEGLRVPNENITGIDKLKVGFSGLFSSIKGFIAGNLPMLAFMAVTTALSIYQDSIDAARRTANEAFDEAKSKYDTVSSQIENFNELYNTWKKTGEGADQLTESGKELSETLKIAGGEALAASENFDTLKKKIDAAAETNYKDIVNAAQNAIEQNSNYGFLGITNVEGQGFSTLNTAKNSNETMKQLFAENGIDPMTTNYDSMMGVVGQALDATSKKMSEVDDKTSDTYKDLQTWYNELNKIYNQEEWQKIREAAETSAEARVKTEEFDIALRKTNGDTQELWKLFSEDIGVSEYFNNLITDAQRYDYILKNISEDQKDTQLDLKQKIALEGAQDKDFTQDAIDKVNNLNIDVDKKIRIWDSIDWEADKQDIKKSFEEILSPENMPKTLLQFDIDETREKYKDVWQAMLEDSEVGAAQLNDVFNENIIKAFTDASNQSEVFKDAFTLLTDSSFKTQQSMVDLKTAIDDTEHALQYLEIEEKNEELKELQDTIDLMSREQIHLEIDADDISDTVEELQKGLDELEDADFNYSINLGGDLIDQADATIEALNDIEDGLGKVGEGFLVAADDAQALEQAFPGILENYTVTAEGMIQLDQAVAQEAINTATTDADSVAQAQVSKLNAYADYATAMSAAYMEEAAKMAELATKDVDTKNQANELITEAENRLNEITVEQLNERDLAYSNAAENEINYSTAAGDALASTMSGGAEDAAKSLSDLDSYSSGVAADIIEQWHEVAKAVDGAGRGDDKAGEIKEPSRNQGFGEGINSLGRGAASAGAAAGAEAALNKLSNKKTIVIGKQIYEVGQGEGSQALANKAQEYQAKALALQQAAGRARAAAASMEANAKESRNAINDVGKPKEEKVKEEKAPKESTPKEPKEETPKEEKVYEPKVEEYIEEEIDLYERVNTQLDDVEAELSRIEKETERLIGPKARANMAKQLGLLDKEIDLQKQKLAIQEREREILASQLRDEFGVGYDAAGFINNYKDVLKGLEHEVNILTEDYNNETTEEGQERISQEIDAAKENLDRFKDLYKRYDELQGKEIQDTINQIEELQDAMEDLRIEEYKTSQQAIDDLKELRDNAAELEGLFSKYESKSPFRATIVDAEKLKNIFGGTKEEAVDYYQKIIDKNKELRDSATDPNEILAYNSYVKFFEEQQRDAMNNPLGTGALGLALNDLDRLQYWKDHPYATLQYRADEPFIGENPFGENTAALNEAYEEAYNRLRELALESEEAWEQLRDDIIDGYDEIAEKEEEQIDRYDRITKQLENIADVYSLVYGDDAYNDMRKIYDQIGKTTMRQAQDQKLIYQQWVERYNSIEDKTSDIAKTIRGHMEETEDKLIELQKNVIDAWQKAFENAIKEITAKQNKAILGVRNIDDISTDWERDKSYADKYYDEVQKANLIEQLRLKYMNLLDDAQGSSLDIQRKIRDSMNEQVKYLEDQNHLSEFNVKYANAQLEILQKQIALEDARNNKNQMRLRRDTQGNYRYVYSANEDDVRNKEADLLQSEFDAYNMSTENRMNTYSDWLNAYQNYIQQRESLIQRVEQGDQEAAAALQKLEEDFARDMAAYSEELGDSWEGMVGSLQWMTETGTDAIREMAENAMNMIKEKSDESLSAVGIQWNGTVDGAIENVNRLLGASQEATEELKAEAIYYYKIITDEATGAASLLNGTSMQMVGNFTDIDGAIRNASVSTRDLAVASRELQQALMGDNAQLLEASKQLEEYRRQLDEVKNSSAVTAQRLRDTQAELDVTKSENLNYKAALDADFHEGQIWTIKKGTHVYYDRKGIDQRDEYGQTGFDLPEDTTVYIYDTKTPFNLDTGEGVAPYPITIYKAGVQYAEESYDPYTMREQVWHIDASSLAQAIQFDTGGYTGNWSEGISKAKNGRIAMLHQKELVLNESDTENILSAVDMVRNMTDAFKMFNNISVKGTGFNKIGGDTIEQRVEIRAEFPNVQNSNEIQSALLSIADSAYQYSYRER